MRESQLQLAAKSGPVLVPLKRKTNRSHTQECPGGDFNGSTRSSLGFTIKQASEMDTCAYMYMVRVYMYIHNYVWRYIIIYTYLCCICIYTYHTFRFRYLEHGVTNWAGFAEGAGASHARLTTATWRKRQ